MAEAKNRTGTGLWVEIPQLSLGLGLWPVLRERGTAGLHERRVVRLRNRKHGQLPTGV